MSEPSRKRKLGPDPSVPDQSVFRNKKARTEVASHSAVVAGSMEIEEDSVASHSAVVAKRTRRKRVIGKRVRFSQRRVDQNAIVASKIKIPSETLGHYFSGYWKDRDKIKYNNHAGKIQTLIRAKFKEDLDNKAFSLNIDQYIRDLIAERYKNKNTCLYFATENIMHNVHGSQHRLKLVIGTLKKTSKKIAGPPSDPYGTIELSLLKDIDDRGHLLPRWGGAYLDSEVNESKNIIGENRLINKRYKAALERVIIQYSTKKDNENLHIQTVHIPKYTSKKGEKVTSQRLRPKSITHLIAVNGKIVSAFTFKNSKKALPIIDNEI